MDLLVIEDKRTREESYNKGVEAQAKVVVAPEKTDSAVLDKQGSFRFFRQDRRYDHRNSFPQTWNGNTFKHN